MTEQQFTRFLDKYRVALKDRAEFAVLLKYILPDMSLQTNLLLNLYDLGIHKGIEDVSHIGTSFMVSYSERLCREYGVRSEYAHWAVTAWCVCYGKNILSKSCISTDYYDISLSKENHIDINDNTHKPNAYKENAMHTTNSDAASATDEIRGNTIGNAMNRGVITTQGEWVYYVNWSENQNLYKMLKDGSERTKLNDDKCSDINLLDDWIYYRNESDDKYSIYRIHKDGTGRQKLNDDGGYLVSVVDGWIYYYVKFSVKRMRINGSDVETIAKSNYRYCVTNGWLYCTDSETGGLCRISLDDGKKQNVINNSGDWNINFTRFIVYGDWLFFTRHEGLNDKLYRVRSNGGDIKELSDDDCKILNIAYDWLYVYIEESQNINVSGIYKMRFDGSDITKVVESKEVYDVNICGNWLYYNVISDGYEEKCFFKVQTDGFGQQIAEELTLHDGNFMYRKDNHGLAFRLIGVISQEKSVLELPSSFKNMPVSSIGEAAFEESQFREILVPEGVVEISLMAFNQCAQLHRINLPSTVSEIGMHAFANSGISQIIIPKSLLIIEQDTFSECKSLERVLLHDRVVSIGKGAFCGCRKLSEFLIPDSVTYIGENAFKYTASNFKILCNRGSYAEQYARDNNIPCQFAKTFASSNKLIRINSHQTIPTSQKQYNPNFEMMLEELELTVRAYNALVRAGIRTVEDLSKITEFDLIKIRNLGGKLRDEIAAKMIELGIDEWADGNPIQIKGRPNSALISGRVDTSNTGNRAETQYKPEAIGQSQIQKQTEGANTLSVEIDMGRVEKRREELIQTAEMLSLENTDEIAESIEVTEIIEELPDESFDGIDGFVNSLSDTERNLIHAMLSDTSPNFSTFTEVEILIESINEKAQSAINDIVIEVSDGQYSIYDDYADELLEVMS